MICPNFIVSCKRHLEKNYFFCSWFSFGSSVFTGSALTSSLGASALTYSFGASALTSSFGASVWGSVDGITFSSVTSLILVSKSIPIVFLIFSAILADLPVLSLR